MTFNSTAKHAGHFSVVYFLVGRDADAVDRAARNQRYDSHRDWMIRSYVLAWSFVFCRLAGRVAGVEDMGGGEAFIWLSWVGPLLLCELALQWRAGASNAGKPMLRGAA